MPEYIVNSAILRKDPKVCAEGAAKMLTSGKIHGVEVKSCYSHGADGRITFIIEAADRDSVLETMEKIDIPVASIMEAEEIKHKK